jgi:oxygen-dependent protoporphyrinogen oxidase
MPGEVDTLVVGAGIAGLAYAHGRLGAGGAPSTAPDDVVVLEAGDRAGGFIGTVQRGDVHFERGPEALQDNAPETVALFDELDLELVFADDAARRRFILDATGRPQALPTGPGAFLRTPLLSARAKCRLMAEPFQSRAGGLSGSVADFIRHRLGSEVLSQFVDPAISGIYAGDPERLSLRATFPLLHELVADHGSLLRGMIARMRAKRAERQARGEAKGPRRPPSLLSVRGGLGELPAAISRCLGDRLQLKTSVRSIRRAEAANGWIVETGSAAEPATATHSETWHARRVVLAAPAVAAGCLLEESEPALSQELRSMVSEAVVSVAHLWPRDRVEHRLDGFGYLVPSALGRSHLGTLFSSSIQPGRCPADRVLLRTLLGGTRHPELVERDDETILEIVRREVGEALGLRGEPEWADVTRWPVALPRYDLDQFDRQARIDTLLAERPGLSIIGNHRRGISVNALIAASRTLAAEHRSAHA